MLKKIIRKLVPKHLHPSIANYRILNFEYGHLKTVKTGMCIDSENKPIPWYTYPAIEYINQFNFENIEIFEFGSGNSTIYWEKKQKRLPA